MMRRILTEPMTTFIIAGALLFAWNDWRAPETPEEPDDGTIQLDEAAIDELAYRQQMLTGRAPTPEERQGLRTRWLHDAVLIREARRLGLEEGDAIVERRLVQKMELLLASLVRVEPPSDDALRALLAARELTVPARASFTQVYFADSEPAEVARARAALEAGAEPEGIGDPAIQGRAATDVDAARVARRFGPEVARAVFQTPLNCWSDPVEGRAGVYLIRVTQRTPERPARLEEVRSRLTRELEAERRAERVREHINALVARVDVVRHASD